MPRRLVVVVELELQAADDVVDDGEGEADRDGVVGADIGDDGEFGGDLDVGTEEGAEKRCQGTAHWPVDQRVEDQLVAAVCVFLPACQLVVDGQRDAFFELFSVVGGHAYDETGLLQT